MFADVLYEIKIISFILVCKTIIAALRLKLIEC